MNHLRSILLILIGLIIGFSTLPAIRSIKYGVNAYVAKAAAERQAEIQKRADAERAERAKAEAAKIPESLQKTGQLVPTQKGPTPLWVVTDGKCLLVSKFEPRAVRLTDGWVIEFGSEATVLPTPAPAPRKKSRRVNTSE